MRAGRLVIDAKLAELRLSRSLLVKTSTSTDTALELLKSLPNVHQVSLVDQTTLRLQVNDDVDLQNLCAAVAKAIINSGADLYQLTPETRDLETLFREVNSQDSVFTPKEVRHAA
jgi:ABC-2 type transport system ATP-binding protein